MGLLLFGFTFYQNKQYQKQAAVQTRIDSVAAVERYKADSIAFAEAALRDSLASTDTLAAGADAGSFYSDSLLNASSSSEGEIVVLENDKLELKLTTKGAQPYSARLKEYKNYGGSDLYLFKEGGSSLGFTVYAGELVNTADFNFQVVEKTDTSVVMRLPFTGGGFIEQKYSIREGEYMVRNALSFVGMENVIPKNVFSVDLDYLMTIPRLEKGYKNESQYSKLDWYFSGEKKPADIGRARSA